MSKTILQNSTVCLMHQIIEYRKACCIGAGKGREYIWNCDGLKVWEPCIKNLCFNKGSITWGLNEGLEVWEPCIKNLCFNKGSITWGLNEGLEVWEPCIKNLCFNKGSMTKGLHSSLKNVAISESIIKCRWHWYPFQFTTNRRPGKIIYDISR